MTRVTADTNILVSAIIYPRGKPRLFLTLAIAGKINLATSQPIIDETWDVLTRRFHATAQQLADARALLAEAARKVSDYLVTGNQELLRRKVYDGVRILTVSDFLDLPEAALRKPPKALN